MYDYIHLISPTRKQKNHQKQLVWKELFTIQVSKLRISPIILNMIIYNQDSPARNIKTFSVRWFLHIFRKPITKHTQASLMHLLTNNYARPLETREAVETFCVGSIFEKPTEGRKHEGINIKHTSIIKQATH